MSKENGLNTNKKLSKRSKDHVKDYLETHNELLKMRADLILSLQRDGLSYETAKGIADDAIERGKETARKQMRKRK